MKVRCEASNAGSDIRCCVCGQGFLLHWSREAAASSPHADEESVLRARVHRALRAQHERSTDHPAAHPAGSFHLGGAEPEPAFSLLPAVAEVRSPVVV